MDLQDKLKILPLKPGVYLMKNALGEVIYVGKAVNLRNRVRSYFQVSQGHGPKIQALVSQIVDFEYIVTDSEVEALILESNLIKEYSPWYNVRLKDDKNYPYIKVTLNEKFPRVIIVRRRLPDGSRYFGPYTSALAVKETVNFLRKIFPIRTCHKNITSGQNDRPCLNYHIGRCLAPCAGKVDEQSYRQTIMEVCLFLEGRHDRLIPDLQNKMMKSSESLEFERAARLRDQVKSLKQIVEKQKIIASQGDDQDVLGYARFGELACIQVFFVRNGKLIGRDHFLLDCMVEETQTEILTAFLKQYYAEVAYLPKEILLPAKIADEQVLADWLFSLKGSKVTLRVPQRGNKKRLVEMVSKNAKLVLDENRANKERKKKEIEIGLQQLQSVLELPMRLRRIEAYDVSNIQGNQVVASMVVFIEGKPVKEQYRRFKIKTLEKGPNDYLAMQEVIRRRLTRGIKEQAGEVEGDKFSDFPDLVLIDGGKGQLNLAVKVRDELGLDIPFIGLAKQMEQVFVEGSSEPVNLPKHSQGCLMLQRIRDEAHRFAITYHRQLRTKASYGSVLDEIPGVGPKRKKALIKHFGSVKKIREAEVEQLREVEGISRKIAEEIYQYVRK